MQFLKHNLFLKLVALGVAVLLAVYVRREEVRAQATFYLPVSIPAPPGTRVLEPPPNFTVRVDLEGPADVIHVITAKDLTLNLDASGLQPAKRTPVPVSVELPEKYRNRVLVDWKPLSIQVKLASDATRQFDVQVKAQNPEGWEWKDPPHANPPVVTVSGAREAVDRVVKVVAPFTPEAQDRISTLASLTPVDASGALVKEVALERREVVVAGLQEPVVLSKRVPVQPRFHALPGERLTVAVLPPEVRITGPKREVSTVYVVETDTIRLPAGQGQASREVVLIPPSETVRVSPAWVRVTVRVQGVPARPVPTAANPR